MCAQNDLKCQVLRWIGYGCPYQPAISGCANTRICFHLCFWQPVEDSEIFVMRRGSVDECRLLPIECWVVSRKPVKVVADFLAFTVLQREFQERELGLR